MTTHADEIEKLRHIHRQMESRLRDMDRALGHLEDMTEPETLADKLDVAEPIDAGVIFAEYLNRLKTLDREQVISAMRGFLPREVLDQIGAKP